MMDAFVFWFMRSIGEVLGALALFIVVMVAVLIFIYLMSLYSWINKKYRQRSKS